MTDLRLLLSLRSLAPECRAALSASLGQQRLGLSRLKPDCSAPAEPSCHCAAAGRHLGALAKPVAWVPSLAAWESPLILKPAFRT